MYVCLHGVHAVEWISSLSHTVLMKLAEQSWYYFPFQKNPKLTAVEMYILPSLPRLLLSSWKHTFVSRAGGLCLDVKLLQSGSPYCLHSWRRKESIKSFQQSFYGGGVIIFLSAVGQANSIIRSGSIRGIICACVCECFVCVCVVGGGKGEHTQIGVFCSVQGDSQIKGVIKLLQIPSTHALP